MIKYAHCDDWSTFAIYKWRIIIIIIIQFLMRHVSVG